MTTFVLIHGAYHGGWCWRDLTPLLEARGHRVLSPSLQGLGERQGEATENVGLDSHVADVVSLYQRHGLENTVLVGHSYGGMVVGAVADALVERLSALIYLDAIIPEDGRSVLDVQPPERRQDFLDKAAAFNGWQIPPPPVAYYGVTDPDRQKWADALCAPQPLKCFTDTSRLSGAWKAVRRKVYIRCTQPALAYMERFQRESHGQSGWACHELATGHDCMITEPGRLADILLAYAD